VRLSAGGDRRDDARGRRADHAVLETTAAGVRAPACDRDLVRGGKTAGRGGKTAITLLFDRRAQSAVPGWLHSRMMCQGVYLLTPDIRFRRQSRHSAKRPNEANDPGLRQKNALVGRI